MSSENQSVKTEDDEDKFHMILLRLLKEEDNKYCADCEAKEPLWSSWNLGIFLCSRCASIHHTLGVNISRIKSVDLDTWTAEQIMSVENGGNTLGRRIYEKHLPEDFKRPTTDSSSLERFIRSKYVDKEYIDGDFLPPASEEGPEPSEVQQSSPPIVAAERRRCRPSNFTDTTSSGSEDISSSDLDSDDELSDEFFVDAPVPTEGSAAPRPDAPAPVVWTKENCFPEPFEFTGRDGVQVYLDYSSTKLDVFHEFFAEDLFQHIADETNRYAAKNLQDHQDKHTRVWFDTTAEELKAMLGLHILMGITPKPDIRSFWSREPMIESPFFGKTMPRDRFLQLRANLHFNCNDSDDGTDRLFKLRPFLDSVTQKFKTVYIPAQDIATDESLWKFHGRLKFKDSNAAKKSRFKVKVYKTCQSSGPAAGYTWNFQIYTPETRGNLPASTSTFLKLNEDLLDQGYNVFVNNWFSHPDLFHRLRDRRTNACGTVRMNRHHMPQDLRTVKLDKGEMVHRSSDSGLLAIVWRNKKDVRMLSNMHSASMEKSKKRDKDGALIEKPSCVVDYIKGKGGVELADQLASSHRSVRKSIKWYKKIFFYLLDLCLVNSYIVYKLQGHDLEYFEFKISLVREILESVTLPVYSTRVRPHALPSPNRFMGRHFPMCIPPTANTLKPSRRCVVCKTIKRRKETRYQCDICDTPLCVTPCFKMYHT